MVVVVSFSAETSVERTSLSCQPMLSSTAKFGGMIMNNSYTLMHSRSSSCFVEPVTTAFFVFKPHVNTALTQLLVRHTLSCHVHVCTSTAPICVTAMSVPSYTMVISIASRIECTGDESSPMTEHVRKQETMINGAICLLHVLIYRVCYRLVPRASI